MANRRMGLRHIEAFRAVLATGSMTEAARRIHTSQPQVSRLIGQLEASTGFPLFHRNGSRLAPTADAGLFSQEVEKTFSGLAGLEIAAARIRAFGASQLSVAAMPRLAGGVLARAVAQFKADHPDVAVSIHSGDASSVQSWVASGLCDVGLAMLHGEVAGVSARQVMTMRCVAILPADHALAAMPRLRGRDFHEQRLVAFPRGTALRTRLDEVFRRAGAEPVIAAEANLGASVCALVAAGLGIAVINPLAAAEESGTALAVRPFIPRIALDLVLLHPQPVRATRLVEAFSAYAIAAIRHDFGTFA